MDKILIRRYASPLGELVIGSYRGCLCLCDWAESRRRSANARRLQFRLKAAFEEGKSPVANRTVEELEEYFAGERREFSIPVVFAGSGFQCAVWAELLKIPFGVTISYGELARRLGNPKAVRAVAGAVGANPVSVIVPCHRVVSSDGSLTGYAGGLAAKSALLALETLKPSPDT